MSINRRMDKDILVYIHKGILLNHKRNNIGLFVVIWMNLESVIWNKESQKEKNKYINASR